MPESDLAGLETILRGHWSAIENGTHYRRDVTLGEDANRTAHRQGAAAHGKAGRRVGVRERMA